MPRPSDMKPSTGRRRHFGGGRRGRKKKLSSEDHGRNGSGFVGHGFNRSLGAVAWLWHTVTRVVGWSTPRIDEGGGDAEDWSENGRVDGSSSAASGILLAFGAVATAAAIMIFRRKTRGSRQTPPHQSAATPPEKDKAENDNEGQDGGKIPEEIQRPAVDRSVKDKAEGASEQPREEPVSTRNGGSSSLRWSPRHRKMKSSTVVVAEGSGERRLSLYDVLTGEAPLPPTRGGMPDTAGAEAASTTGREVGRGLRSGGGGSGGSGIGVVPLGGGARRASIFDRIADVVFNEEQKERDPVDAIAVRSELEDEFRVSFREGAMGMTLSMDPDTRDAIVGKIVEQGQAFRAGVQTDDLVIGVGEHTVSSYGTVLAFMNIMGRPIELRFRKSDKSSGDGGGGSGGGPISASHAGARGGGGGGSAAKPEGFRATKTGGVSKSGPIRVDLEGTRGDSLSRKLKGAAGAKSAGGIAPRSPISPRSQGKVSGFSGLGREVASSDAGFSEKMEHGVVVTKYGKKGAAAQRLLYLDGVSMSVAWRDLDARSPGHSRSTSLTNIIKGKREALALAHLLEVIAGDDPDPTRPSEKGSAMLREHCDESLLERSFALQFKERSLEMTCDSHAEMRQLVAGFRDLQKQYGR
ncbi:unnamed protein product [Ectocarpus sp. 12 AP-2014]